jgi:hypothetical protein
MYARVRVFLCLLLTLTFAHGHVVEQLFVDFETTDTEWTASIRFDAGIALPEMRANKEALQPKRAWLLEQSASEQALLKKETEKYLRECLTFSGGNSAIPWNIHFPEWDSEPPQFREPFTDLGFAYFDAKLSGPLPNEQLQVQIVNGDYPDFVFSDGNLLLTLEPEQSITIWEPVHSAPSNVRTFSNFLHYGFRHVLPKGWDHVLFIAALCCLSFKWRPLLAQSLIFTLGHTITMALSISSVIPTLSPNSLRWIEICIAATILYVALENIFSDKVKAHRLFTIFVFGLIHGLGFASVLGNTIRATGDITLPLIAANLGVELGQVTVIALTLLTLVWFRKKAYFAKILQAISLSIALTGGYWIFQRLS